MINSKIIAFTFFCFACMTSTFSQEKHVQAIPSYYNEIVENSNKHLSTAIVVEKTSTQSLNNDVVSYAERVNISKITTDSKDVMPYIVSLALPFKGKVHNILLRKNEIRSTEYRLRSSKTSKSISNSHYYQGVIEGEYESWATLAIIDGRYKLLAASQMGDLELTYESENVYTIYESKDLRKTPEYNCLVEEANSQINNNESSGNKLPGSDCVEMYIECDHQSFLDNGSSLATTEAWALAIMNDVSTIYNTIDVPLVVSEVFVWNNSDPYSAETSVQAVRDSFVNQLQSNYSGRVAQLFSTRELGGGLAYGLGGLCGTYPDFPGPYSIATSLSDSYTPYPNYSFTVNVVAHELGHVFGARHTHACVWGADGNTQIDDCGNVYATINNNTPEGQECYDPANPILPSSGGTIMSYCNLAGGGIDLANGFNSEVGDYIFNEYISAPCATGSTCASLPPSNDDCANALVVNAFGQCNYFDYDNLSASASGVTDPSCGSPGGGIDVWMVFTAQNEDMGIVFNPLANEVEDVIITVYSGTCGSLTEYKCQSIENEEEQVKLNGLTIGDDYYVRVIETDSDEFGSFQMCLIDEDLPCHPAFNPLVDFYNSTDGDNWVSKSGWEDGALGTNCEPCDWFGVTCDNLKNVIGIDLFNNNLVGTVPSTLDQLDKLRSIKIMNNSLSGVFPDIWTNMADLEFIDLSNNSFTGNMPSSLGGLLKLNTLYIENNDMDGPLLPSIGDLPLINVYWVKNNNFSGCYPGSYFNLCDISSTKFTNNSMLPESGNNFDEFCSSGLGGDVDNDGFCLGPDPGEDCVDDDNTIYPGAPEICDGKDNNCDGLYDEGLTSVNTWNVSGGGNWNTASNWSLGVVPAACMDVVFPVSGAVRNISIDGGVEAYARSVTIHNNNILVNNGTLSISGSDDNGLDMTQGSTVNNNGDVDIFNISLLGISTNGMINNLGMINVSNLEVGYEVLILPSGSINNSLGSTLQIR